MVYLFVGQDSISKDARIDKIKKEFLPHDLQDFNLDILHGKGLALEQLQERFLCLPFRAKHRVLILRDAQAVKEEIKDFLVKCAKSQNAQIIMILDLDRYKPNVDFIRRFTGYAQILRFSEQEEPNIFFLSKQIELRRITPSLKILKQLLKNGERPEKILGGLRSVWQRSISSPQESRKRLEFLLSCDLEIKTGRLKPPFALEKCIVSLCRPITYAHLRNPLKRLG